MAIYHVNHNTGSNTTGDGTALNPWATVLFAAQSGATTGDTIKVAGSATTDVDTAAYFGNPLSNDIYTSVDLTSVLAVGDIITISPKYTGHPEFDGWMKFQVRGVTATAVNIGISKNQYPYPTTNLFTISKEDSFVNAGSSGDYENLSSITPGQLAEVEIEGGYDDTFTSIIGLTRIRRTGLGYNAISGSCFKPYSQNIGKMSDFARFTNFQFSNFSNVFTNSFGASVAGTNLHFYTINLGPSNQCADYANLPAGNYYLSNCGITFSGSYKYWLGNVNPKDLQNQPINAFVLAQNRVPQFYNTNIKDLTGYTNGITPMGAGFAAYNLFVLKASILEGTVKFIPCTQDYSGARTSVFGGNQSSITLTGFEVVDDGYTNQGYNSSQFGSPPPFNLILQGSAITNGILSPNYIKMPTGVNLSDLALAVQYDTFAKQQQTLALASVEDDEGIFFVTNGGVNIIQDTIEFSTGSSSKKILLPQPAYSATKFYFTLGTFIWNSAYNTVTIRAKTNNTNLLNMTQLIVTQPFILDGVEFAPNTFISGNTWTDYTFTISSNPSWSMLSNGMPITISAEMNTADNNIGASLWIDSVTLSTI